MIERKQISVLLLMLFFSFLLWAYFAGFQHGIGIGSHLLSFGWQMLRLIPFVFVLIGLFETWVPREIIEQHMGESSGAQGIFWAFILASTTIGWLYVALPVGQALYKKGASARIVLIYLTATTIVRVPMTMFEAGFLGFRFTIIRLITAIPLAILTGYILERFIPRSGLYMEE